ncbi:hypothetical protein KDA_06550 [Dictyobacter alpinus]|uniref:Uncharacterized protein n=1 Tax=Dictyobacter alpinus TaxID=2014873 RepID=A0A402B1E4_9CHLR|nr:hypothetical protein [Dictyobacter alpinus]GCE25171.1 hypothetical protein KDA_06550 [Dictyobacter alpinus]
MSTGNFDENTTAAPADPTTNADATNDNGVLQARQSRNWYQYLNEDWLATLFGLLLVILLVVGLLHSIP